MKVCSHSTRGRLDLKMTPMIDVVFLLLIFFIWTSSFETPEFDLSSAIALPPSEAEDAAGALETDDPAPPAEPFDELVIRLNRAGANVSIELNDQPIADITALGERLAEIIAIGVQPPIIIDPAPEITMSTAVAAYDAAKLAGADRVLFAAQPE